MTRLMDAPINSGNPSLDEWSATIVRQVETNINSLQVGYQKLGTPTVVPTGSLAEMTGSNPAVSPHNVTPATVRLLACINATSATHPVLCISGGTSWIRVDNGLPIS